MAGKGNPFHGKGGKKGGQFVSQADQGVSNVGDNAGKKSPNSNLKNSPKFRSRAAQRADLMAKQKQAHLRAKHSGQHGGPKLNDQPETPKMVVKKSNDVKLPTNRTRENPMPRLNNSDMNPKAGKVGPPSGRLTNSGITHSASFQFSKITPLQKKTPVYNYTPETDTGPSTKEMAAMGLRKYRGQILNGKMEPNGVAGQSEGRFSKKEQGFGKYDDLQMKQARMIAGKNDVFIESVRKAAGLKANGEVKLGDMVEFHTPDKSELDANGKQIPMQIIEDNGDRVIVKSFIPGWAINPTTVLMKADLKKLETKPLKGGWKNNVASVAQLNAEYEAKLKMQSKKR